MLESIDGGTPAGEQSSSTTEYLLAMHMEIFVPKGEETELKLQSFLYHLVKQTELIPMDPDDWAKVLDRDPQVKRRFEHRQYWENLVYGYSVYPADGYFISAAAVQPANRNQTARHPKSFRDSLCVESITVIKFIITNYLPFDFNLEELSLFQTLEPRHKNDKNLDGKGYALLPTFAGFPVKPRFDDPEYFKLRCTALHYRFTSDYIFKCIRESVLRKEEEVWAQRWHTVLMRNVMTAGVGSNASAENGRRRTNPTARFDEREHRFGPGQDAVICACDYKRNAIDTTI
jgi:hypothetical protein